MDSSEEALVRDAILTRQLVDFLGIIVFICVNSNLDSGFNVHGFGRHLGGVKMNFKEEGW